MATPEHVVAAMMDLAEVDGEDVVYDLGCGDGRLLVAAARRGARAYGVDLDPARVAEARARVKAAGLEDRVTVERGDMFDVDLSPATVVTLFVTSDYAERLRPQLAELKPGAVVAAHWFEVPGLSADRRIEVPSRPRAGPHDWPPPSEPGHGRPHGVYLYRAPLAR